MPLVLSLTHRVSHKQQLYQTDHIHQVFSGQPSIYQRADSAIGSGLVNILSPRIHQATQPDHEPRFQPVPCAVTLSQTPQQSGAICKFGAIRFQAHYNDRPLGAWLSRRARFAHF
jgi:hypothetical protein